MGRTLILDLNRANLNAGLQRMPSKCELALSTNEHVFHVEMGSIADVVAPIIGKQPVDYRIGLQNGNTPAFIREEGTLSEHGPI